MTSPKTEKAQACVEQRNPKPGELSDNELENVSGGAILKPITTDRDSELDIGNDTPDNGSGSDCGSNP